MRVLLIGASGYVGSAVAEHLSSLGQEVVALERPGAAATGYETRTGDLTDPTSLTAAVTPDIDAVVNLATPSGDAAVDAAAITALTDPLRGTGKPFVYTSGIWVLGATDGADETTPTNPIPIVGYRPDIERQVLALADADVRAAVIRPGIVHGRGGGIPALLVDLARKHEAPVVVADPAVVWPMVHIDDLADLFAKVVDAAPAGSVWHGISQPAVPVADLAVAAGRAAGVSGEIKVWPLDEARAELGALFADALALSQAITGRAGIDRLRWEPAGPDVISDLTSGSYR
ncbi:NAD-dependent epimerase/dehydratase family protein [Nocardia huaxiensis]|uniref:NAD-dependent epimerase/dehydratase family protein n=1 Tax=Nocardia huaxiensis TaxID=2755382 RepID=UPI001E5986FB|nr:NAD-dependent epimerase/dehydratase family protein [Nocardia huaxiensis]UFS93762.1 sugar nucleotide-binding protein [Nocardia huaxiensis]